MNRPAIAAGESRKTRGHRLASATFALLLASYLPAQAVPADGVLVGLSAEPSTIKQGDALKTTIKTKVTLQAPSPNYFICEVRSPKRALACTSLVFKKGDTEATGTGAIDWTRVLLDTTVKISAFNVNTPQKTIYFTIKLQPKPADTPDNP
jgi:hypothetical protein